MNDDEQALIEIKSEILEKRAEWRSIRSERLKLKEALFGRGLDKKDVKKDKDYKRLEKAQEHLSTIIKHMEKRLNRKRARLAGAE